MQASSGIFSVDAAPHCGQVSTDDRTGDEDAWSGGMDGLARDLGENGIGDEAFGMRLVMHRIDLGPLRPALAREGHVGS